MGVDTGWKPPDDLEEYRIVRPLGAGAMGQVFVGYDTILDREVAIKFIAYTRADDAVTQLRFLTEARAAARVQHPNIAAVYRVGHHDQRAFIVSELVRGRSLDKLPKPMPWQQVLDVARDLVHGLAAAHRRGVLHRDVKPANAILADGGEAKLLDFGLATIAVEGAAPLRHFTGDTDTAPIEHSDLRATQSSSSPPSVPFVLPPNVPVALTDQNGIVGTPAYMAPERWKSEPHSAKCDVYALGVLLYELCTGATLFPEARDVPALVMLATDSDPRPLSEVAPGIDEQFAAIIDRCVRRDPALRFASADDLCDALERLAQREQAHPPSGNPYRGLRSFEAEHSSLFFGRDSETREVIERLRHEPFVLVTGDSGVGKSSLCRAAVIPRIASGALRDARSWGACTIQPGRLPLDAFAHGLAGTLDQPPAEIHARLRSDPAEVARALSLRLRRENGVIVFIDQLEELITVSDLEEARLTGAFLHELAMGTVAVRVLGSCRADFLTRLAALPHFPEITRALYLVPPMTRAGVTRAIVGPAEIKGVRYESVAMIEQLADGVASAENLPLLQFALAELWEHRDEQRHVIPLSALVEIGGVDGALARHADGIIGRLLPAQRVAAERILKALVTTQHTRIQRTDDELDGAEPDSRIALDALVRGRLLVAREAEQGSAYEIAHEALIRTWGTLRHWIETAAESHAALERLDTAMREWERLGKPRDALFGKRQLDELVRLGIRALGSRQRAFVDASARAAQLRRRYLRGLIVAIPMSIALAVIAFRAHAASTTRRRVDQQLEAARAVLVEAVPVRDAAERLRSEALAKFDRGERDAAEALWAQMRQALQHAETLYGNATDAAGRALAIDTDRGDARTEYADLLVARATLAERSRSFDRLAEILRQLPFYDDGSRVAAWNAPGHLAIDSSPAGASAVIERYDTDERGHRHLVDSKPLGTTPLADSEVAPGSYRLTLTLPSRPAVNVPLVVLRGERLRITTPIPAASDVPAGFVYVPPGRFLEGSGGDEWLRTQFFKAVPLHERSTEAYLIATHETTFGEWIEYLDALSPRERAERMPRGDAAWGAMALHALPEAGWELEMTPATRTYRARWGEPIVYEARDRRARQDWSRFPVGGITFFDAQAYTKWLSATGRVPGARLCSEIEWERAARGADDREYPHGDVLERDDAAFDLTYDRQLLGAGPDEVGSHPASRSPFGVDDMSGNVWEWATLANAPDAPVLRSGSFSFDATVVSLINREVPEPVVRGLFIGLRVCADPR